MRSVLPNYNHVFMPCFLAPASGKTRFSGEEGVRNRGISRNRYVVEITYARVKLWHLLRDTVPVQNFHLIDATWWFALAFSNLCHDFLLPPPDAESVKQKKRRERRETAERSAITDHIARAAREAMRIADARQT